MSTRPIETLTDSRLMGICLLSAQPDMFGDDIKAWAWWLSGCESIQEVISRAALRLPYGYDVWKRLGKRTFDGVGLQNAIPMLAEDSGLTEKELLEYCGVLRPRWDRFSDFYTIHSMALRAARKPTHSSYWSAKDEHD